MNGEDMQRRTSEGNGRSMRARRTQPALPGVTLPTASITVQQRNTALQRSSVSKQHTRPAKRAAFKLIGLGLLLALLYMAMYPPLAATGNRSLDMLLYAKFPWLPHLFWTSLAPLAVQGLRLMPLPDPGNASSSIAGNGYPNLLLILFALAFVLVLFAARVGNRVARERLTSKGRSLLFWTVFLFTGLFGVIFFFAPAVMTQDIFLSASYGRLASFYIVNPYLVSPSVYAGDIFHIFLSNNGVGVAHSGPLWIDMTLPILLVARTNVANILLGFRLLGFLFYMVDAVLIWFILAKQKPEMRIAGVVIFAWNPLVLLTGVSEAHYEIVVIAFILLGVLFFQRHTFLLSWICVLLATLLNVFCLLLLPLFLKVLWKETRVVRGERRLLWWLALISLSALIVLLAFAPYMRGWSLIGILFNVQGTFIEGDAVHSLDAAILYLPMGFPVFLSWLSTPHHWTILAGITIGLLLLFGLWLADTLELVLLFSSWIFLGLTILMPVHWPWFMLLPLALAIVSAGRYTLLLTILLTMGAAVEYYFLLWSHLWANLGLVTIGLPLLIWGWVLFFAATWLMARPKETEQQSSSSMQNIRFSRPSFSSKPSWLGRKKYM